MKSVSSAIRSPRGKKVAASAALAMAATQVMAPDAAFASNTPGTRYQGRNGYSPRAYYNIKPGDVRDGYADAGTYTDPACDNAVYENVAGNGNSFGMWGYYNPPSDCHIRAISYCYWDDTRGGHHTFTRNDGWHGPDEPVLKGCPAYETDPYSVDASLGWVFDPIYTDYWFVETIRGSNLPAPK